MTVAAKGRAQLVAPAADVARVPLCEWAPEPGACRWFPVVSASLEGFTGNVCVLHLSRLTALTRVRGSVLKFRRLKS